MDCAKWKSTRLLEEILEIVIEKHIYTWYRTISKDEDFVQEIRVSLRFLFSSLLRRALQVDIVKLITEKAASALCKHLDCYLQARKYHKSHLRMEETVLCFLGDKLHPALQNRQSELSYLRELTSNLLPFIVQQKYLNCGTATLVKFFVWCQTRDVLTPSVLSNFEKQATLSRCERQLIKEGIRKIPVMCKKKPSLVCAELGQLAHFRSSAHTKTNQFIIVLESDLLVIILSDNKLVDVINHLLILFFDKTPMSDLPDSKLPKVEFLSNFVSSHVSNKRPVLYTDFQTILEDQRLLYVFMQFLKEESSLNVLQFHLSVDEFNTRILNPDLSKEELEALHLQAQQMYNTYFASHALDRINFDDEIVQEIKSIIAGPSENVIKLRTTTPLFRAYDHAYKLLENIYCPMFFFFLCKVIGILVYFVEKGLAILVQKHQERVVKRKF
ncbi:sorting nexin-14 [Caerostris extrusa]|uniref:Sorting nexin-14 n=1 Tax=Caerostris extrusa TaxID=172846 RepID=A0AAV4NSR4_CAEEX|nr:sorting nexin-14 [Caerostris extrusa]